MSALKEIVAEFGIRVDDKDLVKASESLEAFIGTIQKVVGGVVALKVGKFFAGWVQGAVDQADALAKTSQKIGVNALELQKWQYAADLAGVSADTLTGTLGILSRNVEAAATGSKSQAEAFKALGVNVKDAAGNLKDPATLLGELATGFDGVENTTKKTALAMAVLGRGGKELLPLFKGGSKAIEATRNELEGLGAAFTQDFLDQSEEANDNVSRFEVSLKGIRNTIAISILPILNGFALAAAKVVSGFNKLIKGTHVVKIALSMLAYAAIRAGIKILMAFAGPIAMFALVVAAIASVILIVDDLITLFEGGDSVIGEFIDTLFGGGTAAAWVDDLKFAWQEVTNAIVGAIDAVKEFIGWDTAADRQRKHDDQETQDVQNARAAARASRVTRGATALPPVVASPRGARVGARVARTAPTKVDRQVPNEVAGGNPKTNNVNVSSAPTFNIHASAANAAEVATRVRKLMSEDGKKALNQAFSAVTENGR